MSIQDNNDSDMKKIRQRRFHSEKSYEESAIPPKVEIVTLTMKRICR